MHDVLVLGAGIAGLTAARGLGAAGAAVRVLERSRGVGGRCATRRVGARPVDHGTPFLHGREPRLLAELEAIPGATPLPGWPRVRDGGGVPCQPEAFEGRDQLFAFREGLTAFPKHLARGLDVRLSAEVVGIGTRGAGIVEARLADGSVEAARAVVVAVTVPTARRLIEPLSAGSEAVARVLPVLDQVRTLPTLTVLAGYPSGVPPLSWDISLPRASRMVHMILNDSSKRGEGAATALVIHGRIGYSRAGLERPVDEWTRELLWEAAEFHGAWVERPAWVQSHRWRHARVQHPTQLAAPIPIALDDGASIVLCGDGFSPSGGVEGAWVSGLAAVSAILHSPVVTTDEQGAQRGPESL